MAGVGAIGSGPPVVATVQVDFERGTRTGQHQHADHLLLWSSTVTASLRTDARDWVVPPTHGLWVPAGYPHAFEVFRPGQGYGVLFDPAHCPVTWAEPTGVLLPPLVRELIVHLHRHPEPSDAYAAATTLLLALLEPAPIATFHLPLPEDPRTRAIADALIANPADQRDLATWARDVGAGVRTVTRLFSDETGMNFAQWRTHARIRAALGHLARGRSVGATARAVGYRKPGAFAETFRRVTGQAPSAYQPPGAR